MSPQRPTTVSSHANSQRLHPISCRAASWLSRLRALVAEPEHVSVEGTRWVISDELRGICIAAQRATYFPWRSLRSLRHAELVQYTSLDDQYLLHMAQLREDWHGINASNPGSIRVFHSGPDGNCFFYTLSQHITGSEQHQLLLRLHIVIELLLNIEFYMNFNNGIIAKFAGYVNVTSTANGAWRLRTVLRDATSNLGYVPGYLAAPGAVVLGRSVAVHCPLFVADHIDHASFTALYTFHSQPMLQLCCATLNHTKP